MTESKIERWNEIISEFMGGQPSAANQYFHFDKHPCSYIEGSTNINNEDLFYHLKWDWLIPVAVKCMDIYLGAQNYDAPDDLIKSFNPLFGIERIYNYVLDFILWFNENSKSLNP